MKGIEVLTLFCVNSDALHNDIYESLQAGYKIISITRSSEFKKGFADYLILREVPKGKSTRDLL